LQFARDRIYLSKLSGLDLPGECLLVSGLVMRKPAGESEIDAWVTLERIMVLAGLRRIIIPIETADSAELDLRIVARNLLDGKDPGQGFVKLGQPAVSQADRELMAQRELTTLVKLGNHYRRSTKHLYAWRTYRRALDLAVRLSNSKYSYRLLMLASQSAIAADADSTAYHYLAATTESLENDLEDFSPVWRRLLILAELVGQSDTADNLWNQYVEFRPEFSPEQRLAALQQYGKLPESFKGKTAEDPAVIRRLLDSRVSTLKSNGLHQAATRLALKHKLFPDNADSRRALFLAKVYLDSRKLQESLQCFESPLVLWDSLEVLSLLDKFELHALTLAKSGNLKSAFKEMNQASILVKRGMVKGDRLGLYYLRLSELQSSQGLIADAFKSLEQAADVIQPDNTSLQLLLTNAFGVIHMDMRELPEAADYFQQALVFAIRLNDPLEISAVQNNIGRLNIYRKHPGRALENFAEAARQDSLSNSSIRKSVTARNQVEALLDLVAGIKNKSDLRKSLFLQAEESIRSTRRTLNESDVKERLKLDLLQARLWFMQKEYAKARDKAKGILSITENYDFHQQKLAASYWRARAERLLGEHKKASSILQNALDQHDRQAARSPGVRFSSAKAAQQDLLVDELVDLYASQGKALKALLVSENGRVNGLEEMLKYRQNQQNNSSITVRDTLAFRLARLNLDSPKNKKLIEAAKAELDDLDRRQSITSFEDANRAYPFLQDTKTLQEWLRTLPDNQVFLSWHLGNAEGWVFYWFAGELKLQRIDHSAAEVHEFVERHRSRILGFMNSTGSGATLAKVLLPKGIEKFSADKLLITGSGPLLQIPYSTLVLENGQELIEKFAIVQSSSIAIQRYTQSRLKATSAGRIWAAPEYPETEELEFTGLEAESVQRSSMTAVILQGAEALESDVKSDDKARAFRHFSCHALHDPRSQSGSELLLTPGYGEDGRLGALEIATLDLPTSLIVLSACETGLGREKGGGEVAGLPRAFIVSGARSVVSSLWKVEDLATAVLIKHFYRGLNSGLPIDEALREAQNAVRKWVHPHPAYWAAFTISGSTLSLLEN
jgi:CHAT domain-containing protein